MFVCYRLSQYSRRKADRNSMERTGTPSEFQEPIQGRAAGEGQGWDQGQTRQAPKAALLPFCRPASTSHQGSSEGFCAISCPFPTSCML